MQRGKDFFQVFPSRGKDVLNDNCRDKDFFETNIEQFVMNYN